MSKGEQTRDRIVDRAWRLASRDGLVGLSLGRLATELGLSKSGLFAHFGSKKGLELQVLRLAIARFVEDVTSPALATAAGSARLRTLFGNWLEWMNDPALPGGCIFLAAAAELDDGVGPQRDLLVGAQLEFLKFLAQAARTGIEAGQFQPQLDCDAFAFEMLGVGLAYHHAWRLLRDPKAEVRAWAAFERLLTAASLG